MCTPAGTFSSFRADRISNAIDFNSTMLLHFLSQVLLCAPCHPPYSHGERPKYITDFHPGGIWLRRRKDFRIPKSCDMFIKGGGIPWNNFVQSLPSSWTLSVPEMGVTGPWWWSRFSLHWRLLHASTSIASLASVVLFPCTSVCLVVLVSVVTLTLLHTDSPISCNSHGAALG